MAVADVAVEMGPRNRRRLTAGAIVLGTTAATVAGLLVIQSSRHPALAPSVRSVPVGGRLSFGMTQQQVERLAGPPARTQGSCWVFTPKAGMVGSIAVGHYVTPTGDLKLCFLGGAYAYSYLWAYSPRDHKWQWSPWPLFTR